MDSHLVGSLCGLGPSPTYGTPQMEWDGPSKLSGSPQPTSTPVVVPSLGAAGLGVGGWRRVGGGEI